MKKAFFTSLLVLILTSLSLAMEFTPIQTSRMEGLCKVWGYLKYFHPKAVCEPNAWDQALLDAIPEVLESSTDEEYVIAIEDMVQKLGDPATTLLNSDNTNHKQTAHQNHGKPYLEVLPGDIAVIVASDLESNSKNLSFTGDLSKLIRDASKHSTVVIDMRNVSSLLDFYRNIPPALDKPARMPSRITVSRSGYASEREPIYAYDVTLESFQRCTNLTADAPDGQCPKHLVFVTNAANGSFVEGLAALQASGQAYVVQEGDASLLSEYTKQLEFEPGLKLNASYALLKFENGLEGFVPDEVVYAGADGRDLALEAAIEAARQKKTSTRANASANCSSSLSVGDNTYPETLYPSEEYRILALFKLWNTIEYFFPYKDLMDQSWDSVVAEFLPKVTNARNSKEYALAIAEASTLIQDSHVKIVGKSWTDVMGSYVPDLIIRDIEGESIVMSIGDIKAQRAGIRRGDTVVSVDGEPVEDRREWLSKYFCVSTPDVLGYRVNSYLLAGPSDEPVNVVFRTASGNEKEITLDRSESVSARVWIRDRPVYSVLEGNIGYVDLDRILRPDVEAAAEAVKDTDGLILDMRGYPVSGSYPFFMSLFRKSGPAALVERVEYDGQRMSRESNTQFTHVRDNSQRYNNTVAVLINETAQSSAEHACLYMETGLDVVFIGSPTSGANGVISYVKLPGDLYVRFTGMIIKHGDGRQLQRVGVEPSIEIRPTIAGVRAGRDEVLERAQEYFRAMKD